MKKIIFTLFFMFFSLSSAYAEDKPQAMLVFDASGSMWGQINGKAKIGIAKDALNKVVSNWDENVHLGLIAYGHRKKGDCNDIQTLVPIGQLDKSGMISKVKAIKPKGKTPISRSLKKAAEGLRYTEEKATIILISDGKETCDADPCATAKALESEGIDFVTHVIGFDVDKQTGKQLKCIADTTGGEYFSAKNASSLNDAMGKIAEKVKKTEPKPPVVKKLENNLEITASEIEGGKWVQADHVIDTLGDGEVKQVTYCTSHKKKQCITKIPVGKYTLHSTFNKFKKDTIIEIKADEVTKVNLVMGETGKIEITAVKKEDGKWIEAFHRIYPLIDGKKQEEIEQCSSRKKKACLEQIPVGQYSVHSIYNDFKQDMSFEVKADEVTKVNVVMGQTGKIEITAVEAEGGKWIEVFHRMYPIIDGEKQDEVKQCSSYKKKACLEQIPVGQYSMHSIYNEFKQDTTFEIKADEVTKVSIIMGQTGKIEITAAEAEDGKWIEAFHRIYPLVDGEKQSEREQCTSRKKKACLVQIPVGKYAVHSIHKDFKKYSYFKIKAGETTKLHILFSQFVITSKCPNMSANVTYEIYASNGQLILEKELSCSKPVNAVLDSGSYTLTTIMDSQNKDTKFSVGADHPKQITIDMSQTKKESSQQDLINANKQGKSSLKTEEKTVSTTEKNQRENSDKDDDEMMKELEMFSK